MIGTQGDNPMLATANSLPATLILIAAVLTAVLTAVPYLILLERKVSAWIQDRVGPNRAGPFGLLQPLADMVKLLTKEDFLPRRADRWVYVLAPVWVIIPALIGLAVVPLGGRVVVGRVEVDLQIAAPDIGVLYVTAVAGLGVYGVVLGGWASNSKYSFIGGLRATAQLLSYEIPLALSLMTVILISGTLRLEEILAQQTGAWWGVLPRWNVFTQPAAFLIFLTAVLAESNRLPFDLPEAEQELVGGYHTEYSSMKFGLYFLAEYAHLLTSTSVAVVLFLGGWSFYGLSVDQTAWYFALAKLGVFMAKVGLLILLFMGLRWTLPRFRYDQLMRLAWKGLVPASLALIAVNAVLLWAGVRAGWFAVGNLATLAAMTILGAVPAPPAIGRRRALRPADPGRTLKASS